MITRHTELFGNYSRFDRLHPEVWTLFEQFTLDRVRQGRRHYSADAIMHRVRWETDAGGKRSPYKINDHHVTCYARRFHREHPELAGFFRLRKQPSEDQLPTWRPRKVD